MPTNNMKGNFSNYMRYVIVIYKSQIGRCKLDSLLKGIFIIRRKPINLNMNSIKYYILPDL